MKAISIAFPVPLDNANNLQQTFPRIAISRYCTVFLVSYTCSVQTVSSIFYLPSYMVPICTIVKLTFSHSSEYFLFTSSNSSRAATERRVRCESLSRQACAQPRNDQIEQQCDSYYMAAEEKEVEGTQCFHVTFHRGVH